MDPDGTTISDVLKLTVADITIDNKHGESLSFDMWSQGDSNFANEVSQMKADANGYATLAETTVSQDVGDGHLFNDNSKKLLISVLSQPDDSLPPEGTPTPDGGATLMLLGIGSAAVATVRRFAR